MINKEVNLNFKFSNHFRDIPLFLAIDHKNIWLVEKLLNKGVNPNIIAKNWSLKNITPLELAIEKDSIEIIEKLIKAEAKIEEHYYNLSKGKDRILKLLIEADQLTESQHPNFLIYAAKYSPEVLDKYFSKKENQLLENFKPIILEAIKNNVLDFLDLALWHNPSIDWNVSLSDQGDSLLMLIAKNTPLNNLYNYLPLENTRSLPFFNINQINQEGLRLIDIVMEKGISHPHFYEVIQFLRASGSVEPKKKISINQLERKIIISFDDSIDSLSENHDGRAQKLIEAMYKRYPLSDLQITDEIKLFKQNSELLTTPAKDAKNVLKVIEKLSLKTRVKDRLKDLDNENHYYEWSFKKILGTLIFMAKDDQDMTGHLIITLSEISMCDLSQLLNLLVTGQDKVLISSEKDYSKLGLNDFGDILDKALDEIESQFKDKAPLAVIKWLNDQTIDRNITGPQDFSSYTQKVNGLITKIFIESEKLKPGIDSYHFIDGLNKFCITPLLNEIQLTNSLSLNKFVQKWQKLAISGNGLLASEFFQKFVDCTLAIDEMSKFVDKVESFIGFPIGFSLGQVKHYFLEITNKLGLKPGDLFLSSLLKCYDLSIGVEDFCKDPAKYITPIILEVANEPVSEDTLHILAISNDNVHLQGDIGLID